MSTTQRFSCGNLGVLPQLIAVRIPPKVDLRFRRYKRFKSTAFAGGTSHVKLAYLRASLNSGPSGTEGML